MHPAFSIIFFTVTAGVGYGLLAVASLVLLTGVVPVTHPSAVTAIGLSLVLVAAGLSSSTLHLHHPERAWRALSQWRSSWLSREGVAAIVTFVPSGLLFLALLGNFWTDFGIRVPWPLTAVLSVICAIAVILCTAMIYASLKTIRDWHHPLVPPLYMLFAFKTGLLLLVLTFSAFGLYLPEIWLAALVAVMVTWGLKLIYWQKRDQDRGDSTASTATGLRGEVLPLDPPHTEENYLLKEMGHVVARKHATKLRQIAVIAGALLPIAAIVLAMGFEAFPRTALAAVATLSAFIGTFVERWLFFAQARHTVALYYGRAA